MKAGINTKLWDPFSVYKKNVLKKFLKTESGLVPLSYQPSWFPCTYSQLSKLQVPTLAGHR